MNQATATAAPTVDPVASVQESLNAIASWAAVYSNAVDTDQWDALRAGKVQAMMDALRPLLQHDTERLSTPATRLEEGKGMLDPVTAFIEDFGNGRGAITLKCYGRAWTAYWGAMGNQRTREFVRSCDAQYLAGCLSRGTIGLMVKNADMRREEDYVERIAKALLNQLNAEVGL